MWLAAAAALVAAAMLVPAAAAALNTGFLSPGAQVADTGGDGDGFEVSPTNAFGDDGAFAGDTNSGTNNITSCTDTGKDRHQFYNYGFTIPASAIINGIEVRLDAWADSTNKSPFMCVELSSDGGTTWTAAQTTPTLGTSEATFTLGSDSDTWGRTWSDTELTDASFRVRITNVAKSTQRDFRLDWVSVQVTHSAPLTITTTPITFPEVTLDGTDQTVNGSTSAWQADATGETGGWNVTVVSTDFGIDEVQQVSNNATGGTFTLTFSGQTTAAMAYNAAAATVESALEALTNITAVTVTGSGTGADPWVVTFMDPGKQNVAEMTADDTGLTGGTSTISTTTGGRAIAVANFEIRLLDANIVVVSGDTNKAVSTQTTFASLSGTALKIASAASGTGDGVYDLTPDFRLTVPAETFSGSYTATVTVAISAGP